MIGGQGFVGSWRPPLVGHKNGQAPLVRACPFLRGGVSVRPDYPQVKANHERAQQLITQQWGSLYQFALPIYGVRLRTGVTVDEVVWSIQALASWDMREEHIRLSPPRYADPIDGADRPHCSRASMIYLAGAVENLDGSLLSLEDLYRRTPVAVPGWPVG